MDTNSLFQSIQAEIYAKKTELQSYTDPHCYNAAWCQGWICGAQKVLDILGSPDSVYEKVKLSNRVQDTRDVLAEYFDDVCATGAEAQACYDHALSTGDDLILAKKFIANHDWTQPDADQLRTIVQNYYQK